MAQRESLYFKSLKAYGGFVDWETEELTVTQFNPYLHSIILGHIISCCHSLKKLSIIFADPLPNMPPEKFEEIDEYLKNSRKLS